MFGQKSLKDFNPIFFCIMIYEKFDTNIGMLEMDDLDLWYYVIITSFDEVYHEILWWKFMIWIYVMLDDDEMMWDDDVWNDVVLFCVDTVMKWYEMLWKWTAVNDEMMEVDGMNLGVFVSSYMHTYIYIYNFCNNIHIWKHRNYNQMSHSFHHDDPQRPTERTPLTQMANDFFLTTLTQMFA